MPYALEGITVLDFGLFLAGPITGRTLADMGARVIKVEETIGDPRRGMPGVLMFTQRGKENIALDLKSAEGREIVYKLVERADVLLHNMRIGVPERLGIDYETLRKINPRLIYCHNTGYGSRGPKALHPAMEFLHSGLAGILHTTGGEGNPPSLYLTSMDHLSGLNGALAIVMALYERAQSGHGQYVETPQNGVALVCSSDVHFVKGKKSRHLYLDREQMGHGPLNRLYRTSDGWMCIACRQQTAWEALCAALGLPGLVSDPRFATNDSREEHREELAGILARRFAGNTTAHWSSVLDAAGVPAEAPRDVPADSFSKDADNLAVGLVADYDHPTFGHIREVGTTVRYSETPGSNRAPSPLLGQHTREILAELGYTPEQIEGLRQRQVVGW